MTTRLELEHGKLNRARKNPVEFVRLLTWALFRVSESDYAVTRLREHYGITLLPREEPK